MHTIHYLPAVRAQPLSAQTTAQWQLLHHYVRELAHQVCSIQASIFHAAHLTDAHLKLIHKHMLELAVVEPLHVPALQQSDCQAQQVVKVHGVVAPQVAAQPQSRHVWA